MVINKKIVLPLAAAAVIGAGAYGMTNASAASSTSGGTLAQRIASAFGLDQTKVQSVINQYRTDQSANREASYEQRLSQAVTAGKITSAQQAAILAEHNQLDTQTQAALQKTGADRRTALQAVRTEAQAWAKTNNISPSWLLGPRTIRGGHRFGSNSTTASPSPSPSPAA